MLYPCRAPAVLRPCRSESDFSRPRHSTAGTRHVMCEWTSAVYRRPVGDLPRCGFFRLLCGHSRRLLNRTLLPFADDDGDSRLYWMWTNLKLKPVFLQLLCYVSTVCSALIVCGRQLFKVFKFRNPHSNIFEKKILPVVLQTSKQSVKFSFLVCCSKHVMNPVFSVY